MLGVTDSQMMHCKVRRIYCCVRDRCDDSSLLVAGR